MTHAFKIVSDGVVVGYVYNVQDAADAIDTYCTRDAIGQPKPVSEHKSRVGLTTELIGTTRADELPQ